MAVPIAESSVAFFSASRKVASGMASAAGPSRMPRKSAAFHMNEAAPYPNTGKRRESGIGIVRERYNVNKKLTDKDIDEKVIIQRVGERIWVDFIFRSPKQWRPRLNGG
jgi:hypothetical protein